MEEILAELRKLGTQDALLAWGLARYDEGQDPIGILLTLTMQMSRRHLDLLQALGAIGKEGNES